MTSPADLEGLRFAGADRGELGGEFSSSENKAESPSIKSDAKATGNANVRIDLG